MTSNYKPTVKICGIKDSEVLQAILPLPIDHIGFMFANSRRQVTGKQAGELIRVMHEHVTPGQRIPKSVGVFLNPTMEHVVDILREAPLDMIQLHGQESPVFCQWVREAFDVQVIKVISIGEHFQDTSLNDTLSPYAGSIDMLLLDTFEPVVGGGSGQTFAWDRILAFKAWTKAHHIPLLVAGGLHPHNVSELLEAYNPDGVDVSSGVETDGSKDPHKIKAFVERVKKHAAQSNAG